MTRSTNIMAYQGHFHFDAPPATVWAAMEDVDQFQRWGGWFGRVTIDDGGLREGAVLRGSVNPPLPYRMRIEVGLDVCIASQRVDAKVSGDLEGPAHLLLEPAGGGTDVTVGWTIEMMQRPMRLAARVAYPLLRWGHDRVVEATVNGFRRSVEQIDQQRRG